MGCLQDKNLPYTLAQASNRQNISRPTPSLSKKPMRMVSLHAEAIQPSSMAAWRQFSRTSHNHVPQHLVDWVSILLKLTTKWRRYQQHSFDAKMRNGLSFNHCIASHCARFRAGGWGEDHAGIGPRKMACTQTLLHGLLESNDTHRP